MPLTPSASGPDALHLDGSAASVESTAAPPQSAGPSASAVVEPGPIGQLISAPAKSANPLVENMGPFGLLAGTHLAFQAA
eukprot:6796548-Alexandrium_andersonii.AAC.1